SKSFTLSLHDALPISQSSEALRQAVSFGMKTNTIILIAWASGLEQFESLGADLCQDVYFGVQYWHTIDSPLNKQLVEQTQAMFRSEEHTSELQSRENL